MPRAPFFQRAIVQAVGLTSLGFITTVATTAALAVAQSFRGGIYISQPVSLPHDQVFHKLEVTEYRDTGAVRRTWHTLITILQCPGEDFAWASGCDLRADNDYWLAQHALRRSTFENESLPGLWGEMATHQRRGHCGITFEEICAQPVGSRRLIGPSGTEDARGWPRLAFWCAIPPHNANQLASVPRLIDGGLLITTPSPGNLSSPVVLPLRPIPTGLLLNTLFYATLWTTLLFAPRALRRHLRAKNHRCPTCNYDLRNLPTTTCPECGTQS